MLQLTGYGISSRIYLLKKRASCYIRTPCISFKDFLSMSAIASSPIKKEIADSKGFSASSKSTDKQSIPLPCVLKLMGISNVSSQSIKKLEIPSLVMYGDTIVSWSYEDVQLIVQAIQKEDPKAKFPFITEYLRLSVTICAALTQKVRQKEDENLVLFFLKLRDSIPKEHLPVELKDTGISADAIRNWMGKNKDVLNQITSLNLSFTDLSILPAEIGLLTQLQKLFLDHNQLTRLPKEIGRLVKLQHLDLDSNKFTVFPKVIGGFTQLEYLSIAFNQITAIDAEIKYLILLKQLYLHSNRLSSLPTEMGKLIELQKLAICYNQFTKFPSEILPLVNLEELDLSYNLIEGPLLGIEKFSRLSHLLLTGNPPALFAKLSQKTASLAGQSQGKLDIEDGMFRFL